MTPNTKLKTDKAPRARAALPPMLDNSREWSVNGPELSSDAVELDLLAHESAGPDLRTTFDVAIVGIGYVGLPTALAVNASGRMLTSATYLGSTKDLLAVPLGAKCLFPGRDVFVAISPERINPGVDAVSHEDGPWVVGGADLAEMTKLAAVYTHAAGEGHR